MTTNTAPSPAPSFGAKCSHTADGVAYRRTFTGIPHSDQIFRILETFEGPIDPLAKARADSHPLIVPFFESRYLMTDLILEEAGASRILELASGLSPRGYIWSRDPHVCYVELDLPDKMALKERVLEELRRQQTIRPPLNLTFVSGDAKNPRDFERACACFEDEGADAPISFVCEGLLRYLNWPDKGALAELIARRMARTGGLWVTPDIEFLCDAEATPESRARYDAMAKEWDMDVRPNLFADMEHALRFFAEMGFEVERRSHVEVLTRLESPGRLGLSLDAVRRDLVKRHTFVMSMPRPS